MLLDERYLGKGNAMQIADFAKEAKAAEGGWVLVGLDQNGPHLRPSHAGFD